MKKILIILLALLLSACADTPGSILKKEYAEYDDTQSKPVSASEFKNTALTEISNARSEYIDSLKNLELGNMTFSDDITIDIPERVKTGSFICPSGFEDNYEKVFSHYDNDYNEANIEYNDSTYPTGPDYINAAKKLTMSIGCTGFFSYYHDFDMQKFYNESELVKTYTVSEAKSCGESFMLASSDNKISVSEALEKAQMFADDFTACCDYPNEIKAVRINLCECADGYFYKVDYTQSVSGVSILEYHSNYDETDENLTLPWTFAYISSNEVDSFTVNSSFNEYEISGEIDSTVDIIEAAEYISRNLANYMKLDTKRIAFEYCMIKTDNIEEPTDGKELDRERVLWAAYCSYDIYRAEPCWVFYFDETEKQEVYAVLNCDDMSISFVKNQA